MAQSRTRSVTPVQLIALLLAFFLFSGLLGVLSAGVLAPVAGSAAAASKAVPAVFSDLPSDLEIVPPAEESTLLDAGGNVIARFYDKQRTVVPSDQIADTLKKAMVAVEDRRFYEHQGVDAAGISRAFINNLGGDSTQGASTITQQFVRNALQERGYLEGSPELVISATEQTPQRKLREIKYALAIEKNMSKDDILTGYLNIAPFGPITYGVEAASLRYFSKHAIDVTWGEAAILTGLVKSPVEYNPLVAPEAAQERRDTVLAVLNREGLITDEEFDQLVATPISDMLKPSVTNEGCAGANAANAYFCTMVVEQFLADETYGDSAAQREHLLKTGGLTIRTTLDPQKQAAAYNAVSGAIPDNDPSGLDTALAAVQPATGRVLAMAQNTTFGVEAGQTTNNYAANGQFQIGSIFKIFTLIQWFKEGHGGYETVGRSNTTYPNGSFQCNGQPIYTDSYTVNDIGGTYKQGGMTPIRALGISANQAFVNMASRVDFCAIFQQAADMGFTQNGEPIDAYPANIIGSASASPLEIASAYASIINDGQLCTPQTIVSVADTADNILKEYQPECREVMSPEVARQVATTMRRAIDQFYTDFYIGRPYGGKTSTTDDNSNTWMAGFTPDLAAATWVGNANASTQPIANVTINGVYYDTLYGGTFPGPRIWAPFMRDALEGVAETPMPDVFIGNLAPVRPVTPPADTGDEADNADTPATQTDED